MTGARAAGAWGLAVTVALGLSACGGVVGGGGPPDRYRLTPPQVTGDLPAARDVTLAVGAPRAAPAIATDRIAVVRDGREVAYYADARWTERVPDLLRSALLDSFRSSGRLAGVGVREVGLSPDLRLQTTVEEFAAVAPTDSGAFEVRVAIRAQLLRHPDNMLVAARGFRAREPAASPEAGDVVAAFDRAADRAIAELVRWTLDRLPQAAPDS